MRRFFSFLLLVLVAGGVSAQAVHDYENLPEARALLTPKVATANLPKNVDGSADWVRALELGLIKPRATRTGEPRPPEIAVPMPTEGIVFTNTQFMPHVVFPHKPHAEWLTCMNCHESLFELKATGRGKGMNAIFRGEHCGTCHGRVAFSPQGSCYRCHSQPNPAAFKANSPFTAPAVIESAPSLEPEEKSRRRNRRSGAAIDRGRLVPSIIPPPGAEPSSTVPAPALQ